MTDAWRICYKKSSLVFCVCSVNTQGNWIRNAYFTQLID